MGNQPYHILIVDDDANIRGGLKAIIDDNFGKEVFTRTCENGLEAIRVLEHSQVDAVITDIKMPVCTGIDLLKYQKEKNLPQRTVVLSGYDDYNLVRGALQLGAVDYLLKPVDIGLLTGAVRSILASVEMERRSQGIAQPPPRLNMQLFIEHFVGGMSASNEEMSEYAASRRLSRDTWCSLGYVDIKNVQSSPYSKKLEIENLLAAQVEETVRPEKRDCVLYGELGGYWIFLAFLEDGGETGWLLPLLHRLECLSLRVSCCAEPFQASRIAEAREECLRGFERYYFDLPYQDVACGETGPELAEAAGLMAAYDYAGTIERLVAVFEKIACSRPPIHEVQRIFSGFLYDVLSRNSKFIPVVSSSKFTENDLFEGISSSESLSHLQKKMFACIGYYIESVVDSLTDKNDFVIQKAKDYIAHHYGDTITLGDVASHVFLNENYFSTLFRNRMGLTFRQYLRNVRIANAKKLLAEGNRKVYEAAQAVGYHDTAHFVRAFKEVTGESPSEFKKADLHAL